MSKVVCSSRSQLLGATGDLIRPDMLVEGDKYLWIEHDERGGGAIQTPVTFISYTSCPAFVVVSNGTGERVRCPRDNLFFPSNSVAFNQYRYRGSSV